MTPAAWLTVDEEAGEGGGRGAGSGEAMMCDRRRGGLMIGLSRFVEVSACTKRHSSSQCGTHRTPPECYRARVEARIRTPPCSELGSPAD
jgi:hypothetical protein